MDGAVLFASAEAEGGSARTDQTQAGDLVSRLGETPTGLVELVKRCRKVIIVTLVLSLHADVDTQLFPPYFYTRVSCCGKGPAPSPMLQDEMPFGDHSIKLTVTEKWCDCDITDTYGPQYNTTIGACDVPPIDPDSALWSHSKHCTNFRYVQAIQQQLSTAWTGLQQLSALPILIIFGKVSDVYGRRQVFYWTTVMTILAFAIYSMDAAFNLSDAFIYVTAPLLATFATHDAVAWAMVADLVPDQVDQATFFPWMAPILSGGVSSVAGDIAAYFLLRAHLDDYTFVWLVLFVIAVAACVFIRTSLEETMAKPKPYPGHANFLRDVLPCCNSETTSQEDATLLADGNAPAAPSSDGYGFSIVWNGPDRKGDTSDGAKQRRQVLHTALALQCVGSIGGGCYTMIGNYYLGGLHIMQEDVVAIKFAGRLFLIAGAGLSGFLLPRFGPWKMFMVGGMFTAAAPVCLITLGQWGPWAMGSLTFAFEHKGACENFIVYSHCVQPIVSMQRWCKLITAVFFDLSLRRKLSYMPRKDRP